jgi:hypothetical protein
MSPWIPVQDTSLAARPANGASRAGSQSRTAGCRAVLDRLVPTTGRLRPRAFMTSGHFSFRFVICAFADGEMPEIAQKVAVPAVTFDPEATTEKAP